MSSFSTLGVSLLYLLGNFIGGARANTVVSTRLPTKIPTKAPVKPSFPPVKVPYLVGQLVHFGNDIGLNVSLQGLLVGSSLALSSDGQILAVNAVPDAEGGSGKVLIYRFNNATRLWTPYGSPLVGPNHFGTQLALSRDSKTLAVTTYPQTLNDTSYVNVYHYVSNQWTQLGDTLQVSYNASKSVSLSSNGTILAIGSFGLYFGDEGRLDVYKWSGTAWIRLGKPLFGGLSPFEGWGYGVALSADGTTLASTGRNAEGSVSVFRRNKAGNWVAFGKEILCDYGTFLSQDFCVGDGEPSLSADGLQLSLSYTRRTVNYTSSSTFKFVFTKGFRVFGYNSTIKDWQQVGPSVNASGLELGTSISDSGTRVAVNGIYNVGYARVYQQAGTGSSARWLQVGKNINGGQRVTLSGDGSTIAVQMYLNESISFVRTYQVVA
jgi:hypothetical protein